MTDIRRYPLLHGFGAREERAALLSVETLSHAARYAYDRPPSADIVVLESADAVTPYLDSIDELTRASADTNPQFESVTLAASMEHLQGRAAVRVALVWSTPDSDGKRQLLGVFPYKSVRGHFGIPAPVWSLWEHIHSYTVTPLVRAGMSAMRSGGSRLRRSIGCGARSLSGVRGARCIRYGADEVLYGRAWRETDRHDAPSCNRSRRGRLSGPISARRNGKSFRGVEPAGEQGDLKFVVHEGGEGRPPGSAVPDARSGHWKGNGARAESPSA